MNNLLKNFKSKITKQLDIEFCLKHDLRLLEVLRFKERETENYRTINDIWKLLKLKFKILTYEDLKEFENSLHFAILSDSEFKSLVCVLTEKLLKNYVILVCLENGTVFPYKAPEWIGQENVLYDEKTISFEKTEEQEIHSYNIEQIAKIIIKKI